jgi:hypothetical protein
MDMTSLPIMQKELPYGSVAIVAYTVNTFNKSGDPTTSVSFNVQWVMRISDAKLR